MADLRRASAPTDPNDEKMDQIRELLYGDHQRQIDARIAALEARTREMEMQLTRRLDAFQARLEALAGEVSAAERSSFEELARGIAELGERVRRIPRE
jgi:uncharacterized protein YPO0396